MHDSVLEPWMAWTLLQDGRGQLVDVHPGEGARAERVPGARSIRLEELAHELVTLDRERPVIFISESGRTAVTAMKLLRSVGITASAVKGGMRAWRRAGLPVEAGSAAAAARGRVAAANR